MFEDLLGSINSVLPVLRIGWRLTTALVLLQVSSSSVLHNVHGLYISVKPSSSFENELSTDSCPIIGRSFGPRLHEVLSAIDNIKRVQLSW
jgi:hypothetical protein